jgi:hypothetical protein
LRSIDVLEDVVDQRPVVKELRNFGLIVGGVFSVIGLWALIIGGLLIVMGSFVPRWLGPIHRGWMWIGHVLGWINTRIILGVIFYGLITPIGIVFRMLGKDTMRLTFSDTSSTYRVNRQPRPRSHMKFQF